MNYDLKEIKNLAISSSLVRDPKISFLTEGLGNINFLVEEEGKKFVLRIKKNKEKQFNDSLEKEYTFLRYLESKEINSCPKALYYNKEKNFLIETFLEGKKVSQGDFTDKQIDSYVKQSYEIFNLSISDFINFCGKNNLKAIEDVNPQRSLEIYGFNRFDEINKKSIDPKVIDWLKKNLDNSLQSLSQIKQLNIKGFYIGDLQSEVIINNQGNIKFYDFEHAKIKHAWGLTYIKIHGKFNKVQFSYLIDRYCYYFKRNKEEALKQIRIEEKIVRVNDVVWAAMMWNQTQKEEFKELTYKRMKLVEELN